MKIFIVNVNNCLSLSQYEPFLYEHIFKKQIVMIDEISDTRELGLSCDRILAEMNQHPFTIDEGAVFVFIPRELSRNLRIQDYELYNDINAYMNLRLRLNDSFKIYTFYVDRTDELEASDKVYNRLNEVSDTLTSRNEAVRKYLPDLSAEFYTGDSYKSFLQERIKPTMECMRKFFEYVLQSMPEIKGDDILFQNGVNAFISNCKGCLAKVKHMYAYIVCNDVSEDTEDMLKVIYYIKALTDENITLKTIPDFKDFSAPDYNHIRRLLSTYLCRLSKWEAEKSPISQKGTFVRYLLIPKINSEGDFNRDVNEIVSTQLSALKVENCSNINLVNDVFEKLDFIVSSAQEKLEEFAYNRSKDLFNPNSYSKGNPEEFDLSDSDIEDELAEKARIEALNHYSHHNLPTFADENRLAQDLEILNEHIVGILDRLKVYKIKSFLITLAVSFISVVGFYLWAQSSVFIKENSWMIFIGYIVCVLLIFSLSYIIVKKKYLKQISAILLECKHMVENYLDEFKKIAGEFEHNLNETQNLFCLKMMLKQKEDARKEYQKNMSRYLWHKKKVYEIKKNLSFFEHFIGNAQPYEENAVTITSYDHDAEHNEFYQVKVF